MMVLLLLSRLCDDEAPSRTQQARYAVVGVLVILRSGDGDVYSRQVS